MLSVGSEVRDQTGTWARFAVITYDQNSGPWVFSARHWNSGASSYICQLQTGQFKYDCIQSDFTGFMLQQSLKQYYSIASVTVVNFICPGYSNCKSN